MTDSPWLAVMPACEACGRPMGCGRDLPPPYTAHPLKRGKAWCWRQVGIQCPSMAAKRVYEMRAKNSRSTRRRQKARVFGPGF